MNLKLKGVGQLVISLNFVKVLGYDGLNMGFVKNLWDEIIIDFVDLVMSFFSIGMLLIISEYYLGDFGFKSERSKRLIKGLFFSL